MRRRLLLLYLSFLCFLAVCQPSYQERAIYLGPSGNVCHFDAVFEDQLYLVYSIDGSPSQRIKTWGYTSCGNKGFTDASRISASNAFVYRDKEMGDEIRVMQEEKRNYAYSVLISIVLKANEVNGCVISNKPCSCRILGDGQVHHFGVNSTHPPATVYLNCTYIDTSIK